MDGKNSKRVLISFPSMHSDSYNITPHGRHIHLPNLHCSPRELTPDAAQCLWDRHLPPQSTSASPSGLSFFPLLVEVERVNYCIQMRRIRRTEPTALICSSSRSQSETVGPSCLSTRTVFKNSPLYIVFPSQSFPSFPLLAPSTS
jgi:hypothetical protein